MIRDYKEKDILHIAQEQKLLNLFHLPIDKKYYAPSKNATKEFTSFICKKLKNKDFKIVVAEEKDCIIGYAMGWVELRPPIYLKRKVGYLSNIYVNDNFRGKGLGKKLYVNMEQWFKKKKVDFIELNSNVKDTVAIKRFKSYGFKELSITFQKTV